MKQLYILFLLLLSVTLSGCSSVRSSLHYSKGTQLLEKGDCVGAVKELNQAVTLEPEFARNHNNLSSAYAQLDNFPAAWYHARQAVLCPYKDGVGNALFLTLYHTMVVKQGLDQPGVSLEAIEAVLGLPDMVFQSDKTNDLHYQYGIALFSFKDQKLTKCKLFREPASIKVN